MKKRIRRIGNGIGITFSFEESNIYNLKIGSVLDLRDLVVDNSEIIPTTE